MAHISQSPQTVMLLSVNSGIVGFDDAFGSTFFVGDGHAQGVLGMSADFMDSPIGIDQTNVDERNHQVSLMDKIYSRARCVRMCLQDPSISDSSVCYGRLFHCLQAAEHSYLKEVGPWVNQTLVHLFSLRYFRRVWVIQEVALARAAYLLVDNHELLLTSTVMERLSIHGIRNHHRLPGVLRWIPGHRIEADLFTCLQVGIDCEATDARDRVFAMLSLMEPHIRSLIPVDYSLEPEAVYSSAIIAIMATEQNLDILSYASIVHGLVDEDWPRDPSMGMQQFKQYLVEKFVTSPGRSKLKMFEGERVGPWRSTIHVNIVAPASYHEHQAKQQNISCIIQRPQPPSRGLLPLFCVRAHYIDSVDNTHLFPEAINAMGLAQNIFGDPYLIQLERYSWCHSCFKRSQPEPLSYLDLCLPYGHNLAAFAESSKPDTNLHDLYAFLEALFMKGSSKKMFLSKYSVGCADSGFQHGDAIFAIDGARAPFILRKTETQRYRIIGECYLWAALELDYWNPGTKKGRWDANDQGPRPTQTQMIEIY
ncbi:Nn.00g034980.m01.CDS01 [Neocucurbitaria sp. VM-36]